jgi:hypothetical protein
VCVKVKLQKLQTGEFAKVAKDAKVAKVAKVDHVSMSRVAMQSSAIHPPSIQFEAAELLEPKHRTTRS